MSLPNSAATCRKHVARSEIGLVGSRQTVTWSITMIEHRPFNQLASADHGWLKARHHFSFGEFADPTRMGWGTLRVRNDDEIAANTGFPAHPHANMEIITYVREGAITHKDSLGNEGRTEAGDVQVMSARSGIRHAEYNLEPGPTRIFQIWIVPTRRGGSPAWGSQPFPKGDRSDALSPWRVALMRTVDALSLAPFFCFFRGFVIKQPIALDHVPSSSSFSPSTRRRMRQATSSSGCEAATCGTPENIAVPWLGPAE
jgi:hypothetical protein